MYYVFYVYGPSAWNKTENWFQNGGQKIEILTACPLPGADMRQLAKFYQNRSNGCVDMAIQRFSKMAAVCHLGIVGYVLGPLTMSIWWFYCYAKYLFGIDAVFLILCTLRTFQYFERYAWKSLFTPTKNMGFEGFDSPKWGVATTNPPNAHPCMEARHMKYRSSKSVCGQWRSAISSIEKEREKGRLSRVRRDHTRCCIAT